MSKLIAKIKEKPIIGVGIVAILGFLAWLAFGFFGIQAAFIDNVVEEDGPVFASQADSDSESEDTTETTDSQETTTTEASETTEEVEGETTESTEASEEETTTTEATTTTQATTTTAAAGEVVTLASGNFSGTSRYDVGGQALVLNDGTAQRFLRFENFESSNGPDLKVYLRAADGSFVNLGVLKGNIGSQNYEIPTDVDLDKFNTVEIWCERFSVGFGSATLA